MLFIVTSYIMKDSGMRFCFHATNLILLTLHRDHNNTDSIFTKWFWSWFILWYYVMLTSLLDQPQTPDKHVQLVGQEDAGDHGEQHKQEEIVENISMVKAIIEHPLMNMRTVRSADKEKPTYEVQRRTNPEIVSMNHIIVSRPYITAHGTIRQYWFGSLRRNFCCHIAGTCRKLFLFLNPASPEILRMTMNADIRTENMMFVCQKS